MGVLAANYGREIEPPAGVNTMADIYQTYARRDGHGRGGAGRGRGFLS